MNKIILTVQSLQPQLTISTTKEVHPHTLCGMVDLWKNSDKLSCKWGGEHANNNRTFVTVSREMLRNETKVKINFSVAKQKSNHYNHQTGPSFIISKTAVSIFLIPPYCKDFNTNFALI